MQKLPEASDRKGGDACAKKYPSLQKKETYSLSAMIGEVTTLESFLLLVEGPTHLSLGSMLVSLSTSSSCTNAKLNCLKHNCFYI